MRLLGLILYAVLLFPNNAFCAEQSLNFRVGLFVSADSDNLKDQLKSYLGRELRSLGDVTLSTNKNEYDFAVLAMSVLDRGGTERGIAISTTIHQKFNNENILFTVKEEYMEMVKIGTTDLYRYPKHSINVGSAENLQKICRELVAEFDIEVLQKRRELHQYFLDNQ